MSKTQSRTKLAGTISKNLGELMADADPTTQQELADAVGIPLMVLHRTIHGSATPTIDAIVKIAAYYGVSVDSLLAR